MCGFINHVVVAMTLTFTSFIAVFIAVAGAFAVFAVTVALAVFAVAGAFAVFCLCVTETDFFTDFVVFLFINLELLHIEDE